METQQPKISTTEPQQVRGIDRDSVTQWLLENVAGVTAPFEFSIIEGGHSNITYRVVDGARRALVLRRPPIGKLLATAHDMAREHRIVSALAGTAVPVPPALGLCEDVAVNEAPFYIMEFVDGHVLNSAEQVQSLFDVGERAQIGASVVEVLAALHTINLEQVGLDTLGKKEDYLARQLRRWRKQWDASKTRELPAMEEVAEGLEHHMPEQIGVAVVHGDYRLGNMITGANAKIAAVLDWELCTLGDPLADVGYLLNNWPDSPDEVGSSPVAERPPTAAGGFPKRAEVIARYQELTGIDVGNVAYYRAFQYWRLAAIVEGVLDRYMKGKMAGTVDQDVYRSRIDGLASAAVEMMEEVA